MLEYYYSRSRHLVPLQQNYLAEYLNEMSSLFHQRGVPCYAAHSQSANTALFGNWLQKHRRPIKDIASEDGERFPAWRYPDIDAAASDGRPSGDHRRLPASAIRRPGLVAGAEAALVTSGNARLPFLGLRMDGRIRFLHPPKSA